MPEADLEPTCRQEQPARREGMPECYFQGDELAILLGLELSLKLRPLLHLQLG